MKMTSANLIRLAGLSALIGGVCYVLVGVFHPPNVPASVFSTRWETVHVIACAMSFFALLGLAGIYARQAVKAGWLGLIGFVLLSFWFVLIMGFSFVEAFILPHPGTVTPAFSMYLRKPSSFKAKYETRRYESGGAFFDSQRFISAIWSVREREVIRYPSACCSRAAHAQINAAAEKTTTAAARAGRGLRPTNQMANKSAGAAATKQRKGNQGMTWWGQSFMDTG